MIKQVEIRFLKKESDGSTVLQYRNVYERNIAWVTATDWRTVETVVQKENGDIVATDGTMIEKSEQLNSIVPNKS